MATPDPTAPADPPASAGAEILVLVAHPELEQSRANSRLLKTARSLQADSTLGRIEVRDLYALYPDYLVDVPLEQSLLAAAKLVVWQSPWTGDAGEFAHYRLPATSHLEEAGHFTNFEGVTQAYQQALEPLGSARPDWKIFETLAAKAEVSA